MDQPAQCGRTFPHTHHDTTEGPCPGLDTQTVRTARVERARQIARDAVAQPSLVGS